MHAWTEDTLYWSVVGENGTKNFTLEPDFEAAYQDMVGEGEQMKEEVDVVNRQDTSRR
jgi:hypothetical protein